MFFKNFFFWVYIAYKVCRNLLLLPYYCLLNRELFGDRLRHLVREIIDLEMWFQPRYVSISLDELYTMLGRVSPHLHLLFRNGRFNINLRECVTIAYVTQATRPGKVLEIGTFDGFSTYHLAKNCPDNAVVYTLNLPLENTVTLDANEAYRDQFTHEALGRHGLGAVYKASDVSHKVVQLFGDSTKFDFTPYHGQIDLAFIDGGHTYDIVKSDTENVFKMLSDRGVVLWHDFDVQHYDIYRYLRELARGLKVMHIQGTRLGIFIKNTALLSANAQEVATLQGSDFRA